MKGWRRYTWQDMMQTKPEDTLQQYSHPKIEGSVKYFGKKIKKATAIDIFSEITSVISIITNKEGRFILAKENLLAKSDRQVSLIVEQKDKEGYSIEIDDPYIKINNALAKNLSINNYYVGHNSTDDFKLEGLQYAVSLQEVFVKSSVSNSLYGAKPKGSNECGDFVTAIGHLNLPGAENMVGNQPPVIGRTYLDGVFVRRASDRAIIRRNELTSNDHFFAIGRVYQGCTTADKRKGIKIIDGIYAEKEFYGLTDDILTAPETPQWLSTLHWQAGVWVNEKGEADFSFYTGDITGGFKIIAQGVGASDVVYAETTFNVKNKSE